MEKLIEFTQRDLEVGQIVATEGRQISVPDWHEHWISNELGFARIGDMPIIRLQPFPQLPSDKLYSGQRWAINTNLYRQSGLVCFVPERYLGMAILSVSIVAIRNKAVVAQPIEWIEVNPPVPISWIGKDAETIFEAYMADSENHSEIMAIWHNKNLALAKEGEPR